MKYVFGRVPAFEFEEDFDVQIHVCFLAAFFVVGLWTAANAEPMSQILDRCVHRKGCGSSEAENGDVTGCSIKSKGGTGHCFIVMRKRNNASRWGGCAANGHEFRAMFFLPLGPRPGA